MKKHKDYIGATIHKLEILDYKFENRKGYFYCKCNCGGEEKWIRSDSVIEEKTKSCGCLMKDMHISHGQSDSRLYRIYYNMKSRCYNINEIGYEHYGGRGISICEEWLGKDGFVNSKIGRLLMDIIISYQLIELITIVTMNLLTVDGRQ